MNASEPIVIRGAGAIGGTLDAYWARAGVPVLLVDGIIGTLGREAGIATPALDHLAALIHDIEDGRRPLAFATFQDLIDTCTSATMAASRS
jgi:ketopantoate reductase